MLDGDAELRQIERDLLAAEAAHDGTRQAELHAHFDTIDGYSARARAGKLMAGLWVSPPINWNGWSPNSPAAGGCG